MTAAVHAGEHRRAPAPDPKPKSLLRRIATFFTSDIWCADLGRMRRPRRFLYRVARVGYLTGRGFDRDELSSRAAALTYTTLLSLVPLLAFAFSVLKGFGAYDAFIRDTVQPGLDQAFGHPGSNQGLRAAIDQILHFVEETDVSGLGAVGLALLLVSAISLLDSVESALNRIWGAPKSRSIPRKIADFVSIMVVTPICLLVAGAVTAGAQSSAAVRWIRGALGEGIANDFLFGAVAVLGLWVATLFVYVALPHTKVRFSSAAIGSFLAALGLYFVLYLHVKLQIGVAGYSAVYSGFAALPIFLAWLHVSWIVLLLGAEIAASHQQEETFRARACAPPLDQRRREELALRVVASMARGFVRGEPARSATTLANDIATTDVSVLELLEKLVLHGIVSRIEGPDGPTFLPARDLDAIRVRDVLEAMRVAPGEPAAVGKDEAAAAALEADSITQLLERLDHELDRTTAGITIRSLVQAPDRRAA